MSYCFPGTDFVFAPPWPQRGHIQ